MTTTLLQIEQDAPLSLWDLIKETAVLLWKDWPREMEVSRYSQGENPRFTLRGVCPHCLRRSVFMQTTSAYTEDAAEAYSKLWIAGMQCQGCSKHILGIAHFDQIQVRYKDHYPLGKPNDEISKDIPRAIGADFSEALRCLWVDAYNATAEMCRRAIEASCIDLGAPKSKRWLEDKIDWLADQRKITPFLQQVAHKIRLGGNRAAHPPHVDPQTQGSTVPAEEPEPQITKEHAEAIVKFVQEFFHHVYVVPKQLDKYDFSKGKSIAPPAKKVTP